ncbi:MAG: hypothetical protein M0Q43_06120 [Methanothrix sp.]|jgi:hypothetical protein|nr:hypothetical protein [Methanothrix sp.]
MNKYPIVALVLLLAGMALILNSYGIFCPFAGDNSSCLANGNCAGNCSENCGENCTCPIDAAGAQNNSTEENCSALGSCPVKAASTNR